MLGRGDYGILLDVVLQLGMGGGYELHEGRCYDDPGSKVSSKEVDIDVDPNPLDSRSNDGEEGSRRTGYENHEEGGDACSQLAVVFIMSKSKVTDDRNWIDRIQINT